MANIKSCMCICLIGENTHPSNNEALVLLNWIFYSVKCGVC
jgi:hypothetical protein